MTIPDMRAVPRASPGPAFSVDDVSLLPETEAETP